MKNKNILTTATKFEPSHKSKIDHIQPNIERKRVKISNTSSSLSGELTTSKMKSKKKLLNKTVQANKNYETIITQPKH